MRRIGKSPEAKLKHAADVALQAYIVRKFPRCEVCCGPSECGHHLVEKSRSSRLRYELENIVPVCRRCHTMIHNRIFGRVGNNILRSYNILDAVIERRGGKPWLENLERKGRELVRTNLSFYKDALEYFTNLK